MRKKQKPSTGDGRFARLPRYMIESPAYGTLPYPAMAVLVAITSQCKARTSGELPLTWPMARRLGIRSKNVLIRSLAVLLERGLIQKTRQGGMRPMGPTLYALGWLPIHARPGGYDFGIEATTVAPNLFLKWKPPAVSKPIRGDNLKRQRTAKGSRNGPPYSPVGSGSVTGTNGLPHRPEKSHQRTSVRTGDGPPYSPESPCNGPPYGPVAPENGPVTDLRTVHILDLRDSVSALEPGDAPADELGPPPW